MKALLASVIASFSLSALAAESIFTKAEPESVPAGLVYNAVQPKVENPEQFRGKKVAILAAHGVQESELVFPYEFLKARGALVDIVAPEWSEGKVLVVQYLKPTLWVKADQTFHSAAEQDYDLIVLTGGAWNSNVVRNDSEAIKLVQKHFNQSKTIAAICSASQILINAGIAKDRNLTGSSTIKLDLINAGANYLDKEVVVEGNLITSRNPDDLIPFVNAIADALN